MRWHWPRKVLKLYLILLVVVPLYSIYSTGTTSRVRIDRMQTTYLLYAYSREYSLYSTTSRLLHILTPTTNVRANTGGLASPKVTVAPRPAAREMYERMHRYAYNRPPT